MGRGGGGAPQNRLQLKNMGYLNLTSYFFCDPFVAAMVDLMVSQIGPKLSTSNNNGAIGPICDTKKTTVEAIIIAYSKPFSWRQFLGACM